MLRTAPAHPPGNSTTAAGRDKPCNKDHYIREPGEGRHQIVEDAAPPLHQLPAPSPVPKRPIHLLIELAIGRAAAGCRGGVGHGASGSSSSRSTGVSSRSLTRPPEAVAHQARGDVAPRFEALEFLAGTTRPGPSARAVAAGTSPRRPVSIDGGFARLGWHIRPPRCRPRRSASGGVVASATRRTAARPARRRRPRPPAAIRSRRSRWHRLTHPEASPAVRPRRGPVRVVCSGGRPTKPHGAG